MVKIIKTIAMCGHRSKQDDEYKLTLEKLDRLIKKMNQNSYYNVSLAWNCYNYNFHTVPLRNECYFILNVFNEDCIRINFIYYPIKTGEYRTYNSNLKQLCVDISLSSIYSWISSLLPIILITPYVELRNTVKWLINNITKLLVDINKKTDEFRCFPFIIEYRDHSEEGNFNISKVTCATPSRYSQFANDLLEKFRMVDIEVDSEDQNKIIGVSILNNEYGRSNALLYQAKIYTEHVARKYGMNFNNIIYYVFNTKNKTLKKIDEITNTYEDTDTVIPDDISKQHKERLNRQEKFEKALQCGFRTRK